MTIDHAIYLISLTIFATLAFAGVLTYRANPNLTGVRSFSAYPIILLGAYSTLLAYHHFQALWILVIGVCLSYGASLVSVMSIARLAKCRAKHTQQLVYLVGLPLPISLGVVGVAFTDGTSVTQALAPSHIPWIVALYGIHKLLEAGALGFISWRYCQRIYPSSALMLVTLTIGSGVFFICHLLLMGQLSADPWYYFSLPTQGVISAIILTLTVIIFCNEQRSQDIQKLKEKTEKDAELRGLFLSTISHEIRTPLNGILGSAQLILNQSNDEKHKPYCHAIINSAESLNLLIDKVLEYASVDQSDEALYEEDVELKPWLSNLFLLLSPLAEQKNVRFHLDYQLPEQACYYCDQHKLRQILINLLGNAIKFTDQGSVTLLVTNDELSPVEHNITFSVIDTGPGIEQEDIERLTEPYVQSEAGKSKGGTGLGLAITSRLLARLNSQLKIDSTLAQGSCFSFSVRFTLGELSLVEQRHQSDIHTRGLDILLVEDLPLNQKIAIEFMAEDEHKVKLAADGQSAINLMCQYKFDVVLLDMNLPDFSGQSVLKKLKQLDHLNQRTPILAFTASLSPDEVKEYLSIGIRDIVGKPIKQEKLRQAITNSQKTHATASQVELADVLYDKTAIDSLAASFDKDELDAIYNEFVLSARTKLIKCDTLAKTDTEQCIKALHRQGSTALQLGFNRYGMQLKKIERRLLDGKDVEDLMNTSMDLWQASLTEYLRFVRTNL